MREEAYGRLVDLLVAGQLEPGEVLRDQQIAAWLGTSRTPVREALSRLADDGLIEMAPNRFTRVAPLSAAGAADAHRLLAVLEGDLVAELATAHLPADGLANDLSRLADDFTWALWRTDADEAMAADRAFHRALRDASTRPHLRAVVRRLEPVARRAQRATWRPIAGSWPADRHLDLVRALRDGDAEGARQAVGAEWQTLAGAVSAAIGRRQAGEAASGSTI